MPDHGPDSPLRIDKLPALEGGTLVLAFAGWMDGGDVSTGTVDRLIDLLGAKAFAKIDPEPFYIYNIPGSMEVAAMFRPPVDIENGLIQSLEMPSGVFYMHEESNLALFLGKEPNMQWQAFGECLFQIVRETGLRRIVFVGSFGGSVPHTREPRLFVTCSNEKTLQEMDAYGVRRSSYEGPGSFTSYLMTQAPGEGVDMISLVAEIPAYLQGANPASLEAVARRLAKILNLSLDLDSLRQASTMWELEITSAVEENEEFAETVRRLEEEYDNELLEQEGEADEE